MTNENFISEINEELRSDQLRKFWRRFGPWIIAAMVALVIGVAGYEGWKWWSDSNTARTSDEFYAALKLADGTDVAAAQAALDKIATTGSGGYPVLARFREAALLARAGKTQEAVAAYDAISAAQSNAHLRDIALVLAGYLLVDGGDVAAVNTRVGGLDAPTNAMRNAAREAIGLVKYKAGDFEGARQSFQSIVADGEADSEQLQRVNAYLAQLVSQGIVAPPTSADAAAAAAADTAAPSVGDAPALDTQPMTAADPAAKPATTDAAPAATDTVPAAPAK